VEKAISSGGMAVKRSECRIRVSRKHGPSYPRFAGTEVPSQLCWECGLPHQWRIGRKENPGTQGLQGPVGQAGRIFGQNLEGGQGYKKAKSKREYKYPRMRKEGGPAKRETLRNKENAGGERVRRTSETNLPNRK